jgi:cytochrome c oxidase subunit 1
MATPEHAARTTLPRPEIAVRGLPERRAGWINWVTTTDHKKIGVLFLFTALFFLVLGGVEALLMRIQLGAPDNTFLDATTYNQLFTMHGTTMIFLAVVPVFAGLANYLVPLMIGSRGVAFPRLNMLSWWLLVFGGLVLYGTLFFAPPEAGWTSIMPLSDETFLPTHGIDAWIVSLQLVALSSIIGAINLIVTICNMRAPGMSVSRMPLFVWTILIYSATILVAMASFAASLSMLLVDRNFDGTFFNASEGGAPLLWEHLFWFFGHPQMYMLLLPAFGILSEVISVFARKPIFNYRAIVVAAVAVSVLSMLAWGQHLFAMPMPLGALVFFMITSLLIAVPVAIMIFNWLATLWRGSIEFRVPLLFCVAFIAQFVIGGVGGMIQSVFLVDWQLSNSYFYVADMHYVLVGGALFGILAGVYYWFPKLTGRLLSESLGKLSFWTTVIGFNVTFLPMFAAGLSGMPRRIVEYSGAPGATDLEGYNVVSTVASFVLALGLLLTVVNVIRSVRNGRRAGPDPWRANTLEWFTTSPPPEHNFDVVPPVRSAEPMLDIRSRVGRQEQRWEQERPAPEPVT